MIPYVVTLVGDAETRAVEQSHIESVFDCLGVSGDVNWLAEKEACDLFFESPLSAAKLTESTQRALSGTKIDSVCTPVAGRRKKLLVSDMDSTVIDQECIDELGDAHGVGAQIKDITAATVNGEIGFSEALRQRVGLMKGLDRAMLERVYTNRISLKPGARTLVQTMRRQGCYCILVTGGFSFFARRIAERLGFDDHEANRLIFEGDKLTGKVREPVLGRTAKLDTMNRLCGEKNLQAHQVLALGDGANDIKMIEAAGLGVAFHGSEALKKRANACIDHSGLTAVLYVQGIAKSQFVSD